MTHAHGTLLAFHRWLGVGERPGDLASLYVWNGVAYVTFWRNQFETADSSWNQQTIDVSVSADGNPDFRVFFVLGPSDGTGTWCGWNVDDLTLTAFDTRHVVSYDPPWVTAPVRQGNDLLLAWHPVTPAPYYRVEWRSLAGSAGWQPVALTVLPELRIVRGYSAMVHTSLFRVVATDETAGLELVDHIPVSRIMVEQLPAE